jgi:outer membrane protein OmpA-like peptidoglycan-associated protein
MPGVFEGASGVEKSLENAKINADSIVAADLAKKKMDSIKAAMDSASKNAEPQKEEVTLAGGKKLNLEKGTINYELAKYLEDKKSATPKTFVFDHLNFLTGKTELTPESKVTVENLVEIMKAYTSAEVGLQGYTDNQGKEEANKKLSANRAVVIKEMMTKMGIEAKRITKTEGLGSEKPLGDNATEEGRAQNRRLELVVVKK